MPPFPLEQVDKGVDITLEACPTCGGALQETGEVQVKQRIEIVEKPFIVTEYRCHTYTCPCCQREHAAPAPQEVGSGLFSVGLLAIAAYERAVPRVVQGIEGLFSAGAIVPAETGRGY